MKTALLKTLRHKTQRWWYHAQLRECGQVSEARQRERESIRSSLETMRGALADPNGYISMGDYGSSIHYGNVTVSGYGFNHQEEIMPLLALGVPMIDIRGDNGSKVFAMPMVGDDKYGDNARFPLSMQRLPLKKVIAWCRDNGVPVVNG